MTKKHPIEEMLDAMAKDGGPDIGVATFGAEDAKEVFASIFGRQEPNPEVRLFGQQQPDPEVREVLGMTSERALQMASAAMLGAGKEFADKGHLKCAKFKMEASAVWIALHEKLVEQEARQEWKAQQEPETNLGLATTRRLLGELVFRFAKSTPNGPALADVERMLDQLDDRTLDFPAVSPE